METIMVDKKIILFTAFSVILILIASCGSITDSVNGTISGQIFIDDGSLKPSESSAEPNYAATTVAGVTCQLMQDDAVIQQTTSDSYGRYRFTDVAPDQYQIHIQDAGQNIDNSHSFDLSNQSEISLYCMLDDEGTQREYDWAYEFSDMWEHMAGNFDGEIDQDDMQQYWDMENRQWGNFGTRSMNMMEH
jgi:hypothetical protein